MATTAYKKMTTTTYSLFFQRKFGTQFCGDAVKLNALVIKCGGFLQVHCLL